MNLFDDACRFDDDKQRHLVNLNRAELLPFQPWRVLFALQQSDVFTEVPMLQVRMHLGQKRDLRESVESSEEEEEEEMEGEEEKEKQGEEEEKESPLQFMMTEAVVITSPHQDQSATMIHPETGEKKESGLRVVVGKNECWVRQTISSSHRKNPGDLQDESTIGWRCRFLVCLLIFMIFPFTVFFLKPHSFLSFSFSLLKLAQLRLKSRCLNAHHDASQNWLSSFALVFTFSDHDWTNAQMEVLEKVMIDYMNFLRDSFTGVNEFCYSAPKGMKSVFKLKKKGTAVKREGAEDDGEYFYSSDGFYHVGYVQENAELGVGCVSNHYEMLSYFRSRR